MSHARNRGMYTVADHIIIRSATTNVAHSSRIFYATNSCACLDKEIQQQLEIILENSHLIKQAVFGVGLDCLSTRLKL
jgi:hypothetical protein